MGEDYYSLNRDELIEKLKSKDKQITEMTEKYNCLKADTTKEIEKAQNMRFETFQELKKENGELKNIYDRELKSQQERYEMQINGLKETIVLMATSSYNAQESFFHTIRNIDKKLDMINIRRGKHEQKNSSI